MSPHESAARLAPLVYVVLKGRLKFVGQWEGKDTAGAPICGPTFDLDDDTGEIPVIYLIRCDQQEVSRVSAMAGGRAIIYATIDSATVTINAMPTAQNIAPEPWPQRFSVRTNKKRGIPISRTATVRTDLSGPVASLWPFVWPQKLVEV